MPNNFHQRGFTVFEIVIVVVAVVILGTIGYLFYANVNSRDTETASVTPSPSTEVVTKIENTSDLDTTSTALDKLAIEDDDSAQLDSITDDF